MKILIIGALGAGKSTLAYQLSKTLQISRLNLDEVCRNKKDGSYRSEKEKNTLLNEFKQKNPNQWIAEGSDIFLLKKMNPDLIVYVKTNRLTRLFRFTTRFIKAKKLIGKEINPDLPVQAYHYRKLSIKKIRDYDVTGLEIIENLNNFIKKTKTPVLFYKNKKDIKKIITFMRQKND